jgi:hypothetical protein
MLKMQERTRLILETSSSLANKENTNRDDIEQTTGEENTSKNNRVGKNDTTVDRHGNANTFVDLRKSTSQNLIFRN